MNEEYGSLGDHRGESLLSGPPLAAASKPMVTLQRFTSTSGGSILFCLSAVSILYGLSSVVGPILGSSQILSETLPAIGTIGIYELSLFGVLLALVLRWNIAHDAISLLVWIAVFFITIGMLVSTVANDNPLAVIGVGIVATVLAFVQMSVLHRRVEIPFAKTMLTGIAILIAWNCLGSVIIAYYIRPEVDEVRKAMTLWPAIALVPIAGALLLYAGAFAVKTGQYATAHRDHEFLRTPGMAWIFIGILTAGTGLHQRAMIYLFDLPFYLVDFLPLACVAALAGVEVMRAYGYKNAVSIASVATAPLLLLMYALYVGSYNGNDGIGGGLLAHPAITLGGAAALLLASAARHRQPVLGGVAVAYLLCVLLTIRPSGGPANEVTTMNWEAFCIGLGALVIALLLVTRSPLLSVVGVVAVTFLSPLSSTFQDWVQYDTLTNASRVGLMGGMLGSGLLLLTCLFGKRLPRFATVTGATVLVGAVLLLLLEKQLLNYPVLIPVILVFLGGIVFWRIRDWLTVAILSIPLFRLIYFALGEAGGWRYMLLGFILLAIGAVYSVRAHAGKLEGSKESGVH